MSGGGMGGVGGGGVGGVSVGGVGGVSRGGMGGAASSDGVSWPNTRKNGQYSRLHILAGNIEARIFSLSQTFSTKLSLGVWH